MHRGERTYIDAMYYFEPYGLHQQPSENQRNRNFGAIGSHFQYPRCHPTVYEQHKRRKGYNTTYYDTDILKSFLRMMKSRERVESPMYAERAWGRIKRDM
eukprot:2366742-Karenia_brevis.AAC.1